MNIERILLLTDFSSCARQAYGPAAGLARRLGARLDLVHCKDHPLQYSAAGFAPSVEALQAVERAQEEHLQSESREEVFQGLPVQSYLLPGDAVEAVLGFARRERSDLLVQASHGRSGWKRFVLGSFSERILRASPVPVLTLRACDAPTPPKGRSLQPRRILYPYDFSADSRKAIEPARFLAAVYEAPVKVLFVWRSMADLLPIYGTGGEATDVELFSVYGDYLERLRKDLNEFADAEFAGLPHEGEAMVGNPAMSILEEMDPRDLVCMATHGWTGLRRVVMGSVTEKVLRGATCPILTVRAGQAAVAAPEPAFEAVYRPA